MKRSAQSLAVAAWALLCSGQQPEAPPPAKPALEYAGKPLKLAGTCKPDDLNAQGLTCSSDDPCPLYLELSDVEPLGVKLFLTGNLHTASATLESILLVSEDGGKTWTEGAERIPLASIDQMTFIDFENGWASGQVVMALPRDPFMLITGDGGKTWRRRPLYGESRPGAIEQFWFESKSNGKLLVDRGQVGDDGMRHELYETRTGGDSWSLLQVDSKPLNVKRPIAPPSDWRLRPDAALKAFRVERNQSGKWGTVASFLVSAGECKTPEPTLAEPPPPEEKAPEPPPAAAPAKRPAKPPALRK